ARFEVETFAVDDGDFRGLDPAAIDQLGDVRLERPHLSFSGLPRAFVRLTLLKLPRGRLRIVLTHAAIELARQSSDRPLVANVRRAKPAGSESAEMLARFDEHDRFAH